MDGKRKYDLKNKLSVDSDKSWLTPENNQISDSLKKEILDAVTMEMVNNTESNSRSIKLVVRTVAAACILSFALFTWEQFYSLRKINKLEQSLIVSSDPATPTYKQDKILIINSFFSWEDIVNIATHHNQQNISEFYPSWFSQNLIGDGKIKMKIAQYFKEYQLATKIN